MTVVLIVEDEESYREALAYMLGREGFDVVTAADGAAGLAEFDRHGADIVLLDLMMPGLSGTEVCRQLRQRSAVPIIMVTARDDEIDKVVGLELGADDYVTKPFSPKALVARVKALLRRLERNANIPQTQYHYGPLTVDLSRHEVRLDGQEVALTAKEFGLLEHLLRNIGRVLTRDVLLSAVWGYDYYGTTRTVDVHVRRLKQKLPLLDDAIISIKSLGYKLRESDVPA